MAPLLEGLQIEGSYSLKAPCYNQALINPDTPECLKGSPWVQHAQATMGGPMNGEVDTVDNFHQVWTMTPVHLPEIDTKCDSYEGCVLKTISVSENFYDRLDEFDTGSCPIAALETKAKLMSRQSI